MWPQKDVLATIHVIQGLNQKDHEQKRAIHETNMHMTARTIDNAVIAKVICVSMIAGKSSA